MNLFLNKELINKYIFKIKILILLDIITHINHIMILYMIKIFLKIINNNYTIKTSK